MGAGIRTFGRRVNGWPHVAGRFRQTVGPPAGRGAENKVLFWAGVNRGRIIAAVEFAGFGLRRRGGNNFEARNLRGIAVPFPADQPGNAVSFLHAGALENPMVRLRADPIRAAGHLSRAVRADQFVGVGPLVWKRINRHKIPRAARRAKNARAPEDPIRRAAQVRPRIDTTEAGIAREEGHVKTVADSLLEMVEHFDGVIFVVPDGEESFRPQKSFWVRVRVEVGNVGDIITLRLQPVRDGKLPEKPFTRTRRERGVENLAIFSVRPVEADIHTRSPIPLVFPVVIESKLIRPTIVRLPGCVGTLKNEIRAPVVAHDENHVALELLAFGGEFAKVNAAHPVARDFESGARFPLTVAQTIFSNGRVGLSVALEWPKSCDVPPTGAAVVTHAINIQRE